VFGTSGNFSVVVRRDPLRLLITASGRDKGRLGGGDFAVVGDDGQPLDPNAPRPSAETLLHAEIARQADVGAVLHTHSVWSTLLSDQARRVGAVVIEGYEMLKGLAGVGSHEHRLRLPVFDNTQDIPALARELRRRLAAGDPDLRHGFLLRRHGLYTWGRDLDEACRHVEVLEFLFEVVGRTPSLVGAGASVRVVA
jgi:methylthioribulose-1-phosphate dehydratase